MSDYRIIDEPAPSGLTKVSVAPFWPLLALMFGGAWLAWPWMLINSFAIGSATRLRETAIVVGTFVFTIALSIAVLILLPPDDSKAFEFGVLALQVVKFGCGYWIFAVQSRSFSLYEYFGGRVSSGLVLIVAGYILRRHVLLAFDSLLWTMVVA
ncbi:MAG: hypothetical protein AAGE52_20125 [Myxococcota bacterium]